ncbi:MULTISPECIES: hypothetical protein [Paenibacillus]|uniref:Uncharacterized protein n=1 Tax=Paenibacillus amylolyticus TaxID=1451 RepID=A0ABD8AWA9_PAEAM|nr:MULTISPECIES: hypothetical protein [Paenibacillus]ETT50424.1 hypothetical protein C170_15780 [Paenibacillus sp. FSL H7-689]OME97487.1 hypothetical protein BK124_15935 [Paenibacillus amylolyticus]
MADTIKNLFEGNVPTTSSKVYTVPTNKYAVVKSAIICNYSASDALFTLTIGGSRIAQNHVIKPGATLVLSELDIPIIQGEEIYISSNISGLSIFLTGFERNYEPAGYPFVKVTATSADSIPSNDFDSIIRSIIICNGHGSVSSEVSMNTGWYLISKKVIKARDTLIVPLPKVFLPKGRPTNFISTGTNSWVTLILEKAVQ